MFRGIGEQIEIKNFPSELCLFCGTESAQNSVFEPWINDQHHQQLHGGDDRRTIPNWFTGKNRRLKNHNWTACWMPPTTGIFRTANCGSFSPPRSGCERPELGVLLQCRGTSPWPLVRALHLTAPTGISPALLSAPTVLGRLPPIFRQTKRDSLPLCRDQRWTLTLTSRSNARHRSNTRPAVERSERSYFFEKPKAKIVPSTAIFVDRWWSQSLGIDFYTFNEKNVAPHTSNFPKV